MIEGGTGAPPASATAVGHVAATVHGRYLLRPPVGGEARALVVGFHGYGENAERHLADLARLTGSARFWLGAVQALHPFYNSKTGEVIASWMTRQDRELAIEDNVRYTAAAVAAMRAEAGGALPLVYAGFSQGVAMAYRAAAGAGHRAVALVALAGDVPPDVAKGGGALPPILIGRGTADEWYTGEKMDLDLAALAALGATAETCVFEGGHFWHPEVCAAAGEFLERVLKPSRPI